MNVVNQKKENLEKENVNKEKTLGEKIVEGRRKKGLSQEKFAEKMGCTRQMVSRWELDQSVPRTQKIKKISSILDISIEELIGKQEDKNDKTNKLLVKKLTNRKNILKYLLIFIITLVALYFLYSGYKWLVLNLISSKIEEYKNANNYYLKEVTYIEQNIIKKEEVWYKDGLYKIVQTNIVNNTEDRMISYLDVNNGYRYLIDEENKTYSQVKLFNSEQYDDGKYMYLLFPVDIIKENNDFRELAFKINKVYSYIKDKEIYLIINDERIQFDKDTLLPIYNTVIMQENQNKLENNYKYDIELNNVTDEDVKISENYKKIN